MRTKIIAFTVLIVIVGTGYVVWQRPEPVPSPTKIPETKTTEVASEQTNQEVETEPELPAFDKKQFSIIDPVSPWVIVNKARPLDPAKYAPGDLINVGGGQQLRKAAANAFRKLKAAAEKAGYTLLPLSGYRSYNTQVTVYANEVRSYGQSVADTQSARPGHSEHQTGWAIDVGGGGCGIEDCFGNTAEGKWLAKNAYKYGFIVRYVSGKESVTGYRPEPWHIRYVGVQLAVEMNRTDVKTLEEFFDAVEKQVYQRY